MKLAIFGQVVNATPTCIYSPLVLINQQASVAVNFLHQLEKQSRILGHGCEVMFWIENLDNPNEVFVPPCLN